jgi:hypothetical protein
MTSELKPEDKEDKEEVGLSAEITRLQEDAVRKTLEYRDALVSAVRDGTCFVAFGSFVGVRLMKLMKPGGEGVEVYCSEARPGCKELLRAVASALGEPIIFNRGNCDTLFIKCKTVREPSEFPRSFSTPEEHANVVLDAVRKGLKIRCLFQAGGSCVRCYNSWGGLSRSALTPENRVQFYRVDVRTDVFVDTAYGEDAVMRRLQDACFENMHEVPVLSGTWTQPGVEGTYQSFNLFCA